MPTDDATRFRNAQALLLAKLKARTTDRPDHARFLRALLDAEPGKLDEVTRPARVSRRVADALTDDVHWCRRPAPPEGHMISPFPAAYNQLRVDQARTAHDRAARREQAKADTAPPTLRGLLTLPE